MLNHTDKLKPFLTATLAAATLAALIAAACYGPHDNSPTAPTTQYKLTVASGNGASGPVGLPLATPLGAAVTNENGVRQIGIRVDFKILEGTGNLSPATTVTDTSGIAWTRLTPTYAPGEVKVQAQIFATSTKVIITCNGT